MHKQRRRSRENWECFKNHYFREELKTQKTKLNIEHARKMKEKNIDLNTISEITGLSIKEIEDL